MPDAAELTPAQAMTLICAIESVGGVDIYDEDEPSVFGILSLAAGENSALAGGRESGATPPGRWQILRALLFAFRPTLLHRQR